MPMDQAPRRRFRSADGGGGGGGGVAGAPRRRAMADCRSSAKASRRPVHLPADTEKAWKALEAGIPAARPMAVANTAAAIAGATEGRVGVRAAAVPPKAA